MKNTIKITKKLVYRSCACGGLSKRKVEVALKNLIRPQPRGRGSTVLFNAPTKILLKNQIFKVYGKRGKALNLTGNTLPPPLIRIVNAAK